MKSNNVNLKKYMFSAVLVLAMTAGGCKGYLQSNTATQMFYGLFFSTTPVLENLVITATDSSSITLEQPNLFSTGNPMPTVQAYIGADGLITITGSTVGGIITEGPVDVSAGPYTFNGLAGNTVYRIIVVAENSSGYSVSQITQSTGGIAPVLNPLVITATDFQSITLAQPTFTTAGNPLPPTQTRLAYIGLDGTIAVNYTTGVVTGSIGAPLDVTIAAFPYTFTGLTANTAYRIIVVAENSSGVSIREIAQNTANTPPVLNPLAINSVDDQNIQLATVSYATQGFPVPAVANAYIGLDGVIAVDPLGAVTNETDGPYDVDSAPHTFTGLTPNTAYRIIVVSQNASGVSVRQITQTTGPSAPVLDPLGVNSVDETSIEVDTVSYARAGFPVPAVANAYIGLDGVIAVDPLGAVTNETDGPYDVDSAPHTFMGLTPNTTYRIIVVSSNASGVSIREITQTTSPDAPLLAPLTLTSVTNTNIRLAMVSYTRTGNPVPATADAYIGLDGTISVDYSTGAVSNEISGPFDVDSTFHDFPVGASTTYRIIVVASNASGVSIRQIVATTPP